MTINFLAARPPATSEPLQTESRAARSAFNVIREPPERSPSLFQELVDSLVATVLPADCSLCGEELSGITGAGICRKCWKDFRAWTGPLCSGCGLPFPSERALESSEALCAECRRQEYSFDLARSFGLYAGNLRAAILRLKFHRRERLGLRLGELLCPLWCSIGAPDLGDPPILLPVPLHRHRQRQRGYNQAELLARGLAKGLARHANSPAGAKTPLVETDCLGRIRPTLPQTGLDPRARQENVRGVFTVFSPERIHGRTVLLVDDVMTTGATVSACAAALKGAGARRVRVLTLARATPQFPDIAGATARAFVTMPSA